MDQGKGDGSGHGASIIVEVELCCIVERPTLTCKKRMEPHEISRFEILFFTFCEYQ